jgi:hypothetical protein
MAPARLTAKLREIVQAAEDYDVDRVQTAVESLLTHRFDEPTAEALRKILAAAKNFDYKDISNEANALLNGSKA